MYNYKCSNSNQSIIKTKVLLLVEVNSMRKIIVSKFMTLDIVMESPEKWNFQYWNEEIRKFQVRLTIRHMIFPVVWGNCKRFSKEDLKKTMKLEEVKTFSSAVVLLKLST